MQVAKATGFISVGQGSATVRLVISGINSTHSSSCRGSGQGLQAVKWSTLTLCGSVGCIKAMSLGRERHAKC